MRRKTQWRIKLTASSLQSHQQLSSETNYKYDKKKKGDKTVFITRKTSIVVWQLISNFTFLQRAQAMHSQPNKPPLFLSSPLTNGTQPQFDSPKVSSSPWILTVMMPQKQCQRSSQSTTSIESVATSEILISGVIQEFGSKVTLVNYVLVYFQYN